MAEIDVTRRRDAAPVLERTGFRLSWGAVIAGMFVATAVHMVLALLGMAIGFDVWDVGDQVGEIGAGVGIWVVISGIIALFVGGLVAGRMAGILTRGDGMMHGVVLWSLASVFVAWLVLSGLGRVLGGAFGIIGRTTAAAVGGIAGGAGQLGATALGQLGAGDLESLRQEIARALEQTGVPALQPESLRAQAQQLGQQATGQPTNEELSREIVNAIQQRAGQVDREAIINVVAARTELSREEAERVATRVETAAQSFAARIGRVADTLGTQLQTTAAQSSEAIASAAWWTLLTLGLSLAAAVGGTAITARD